MCQLTLWALEGLDLTPACTLLHRAGCCGGWACTSLWLGLALAVPSSVDHTPLGLCWVLGVEQLPCRGCEVQSPWFVVLCYMVC